MVLFGLCFSGVENIFADFGEPLNLLFGIEHVDADEEGEEGRWVLCWVAPAFCHGWALSTSAKTHLCQEEVPPTPKLPSAAGLPPSLRLNTYYYYDRYYYDDDDDDHVGTQPAYSLLIIVHM